MNTLQSTAEPKLNRLIVPQENPELEALWTSVFADEYKPAREINYEKIKSIFSDPKIRELCDYMLSIDSSKRNSISVLESLSKNQKDTLVDLLLRIPLEKLHEKDGLAMIFWLRNYSAPYHDKHREMFQEFWINSEGKDRYNLLEKARNAQNQCKRDIGLTLKQYIIFRNFANDISEDSNIEKLLPGDFSLLPLISRDIHEKGKEKDWYQKDLDAKGKPIAREVFSNISSYKENESGRGYRDVPNYDNPDIHRDFSGSMYRIYLDGPIAIGLCHNQKPVALISFSLKDIDSIYIHQMQKVSVDTFDRYGRNTGHITNPILQTCDRQKILYDMIIVLAKKYQLKHIILKSSINNERTQKLETEWVYSTTRNKRIEVETDKPHLSKEIAKKIYDNFALKQGFEEDKQTKDWKRGL